MGIKFFAAVAASVASLAIAQEGVNMNLWFDGSDPQVNTGGDCIFELDECEETTMGFWYDYDDRKNGHGGSYVIYPYDTTGYYGSLIGPEIDNLGFVTIKYHLVDFVGFGFNVVNSAMKPLDISATGGLCATYTSDHAVTLKVVEETSGVVYGGASCSVILDKATTPTTISKAIVDFKQSAGTPTANKLSSCAKAFKAAKAIWFEIDGETSETDGQLRIFEVGPAGTCTGEKSIDSEKWTDWKSGCVTDGEGGFECSSSSSSISYSSSSVNMDLWFDGTNEQVNTGGDCLYKFAECEWTSMGYWYDMDDRKNDNGGSYAIYPFDTVGYYGSLTGRQIDDFGYVSIKYHLADPTLTGQKAEQPYNYVLFGFNTVDGSMGDLDISGTGGLCATYTSDNDVTLEIKDPISGNASCSVTLAATTTPTTVSKAIADFKQPKGTPDSKKLISCESAFVLAQAIWFKINGGGAEANGQLRIFEVGPIGTCTGEVSIVEEEWENLKTDREGHLADLCCATPIKIQTRSAAASRSVSVNGRIVSLNGFGSSVSYRLFDLQGNVVRSGYAAGSIDFGGVKSGNYVLKVGGTAGLTEKILLK